MQVLAYLASLVLAVPAVALATWILLIGHVIATRNVLTLLGQFFEAFGRGLPAAAIALLVLILAGCFSWSRYVAAFIVFALNLAALLVILRSPASPADIPEATFLVPAVVSAALALWLVHGHFRSGKQRFGGVQPFNAAEDESKPDRQLT